MSEQEEPTKLINVMFESGCKDVDVQSVRELRDIQFHHASMDTMLQSRVFVGMTCAEIIKEILQEYDDFEIVDGNSVATIDEPVQRLEGECKECGGPCKWEYDQYYDWEAK